LKILLDHNLDRRLKQYFQSSQVYTVHEQGWDSLKNGELLSQAEANGFTVLLTADANIKHQQNLTGRSISIVVMRAPNNRLTTHLQLIDKVEKAIETLLPGTVVEVRPSLSKDDDLGLS
jgi:predicted nuclease of predicted toxin-antitoxin system